MTSPASASSPCHLVTLSFPRLGGFAAVAEGVAGVDPGGRMAFGELGVGVGAVGERGVFLGVADFVAEDVLVGGGGPGEAAVGDLDVGGRGGLVVVLEGGGDQVGDAGVAGGGE